MSARSVAAGSADLEHGRAPLAHEGVIDGVALCRAPIFVIGSPRSGTTILPTALARHPSLWTSHESYVLHDLFGNGRAGQVHARHASRPTPSWLMTNKVSRDEFLAALGVGMNALFSSRSGGRRWIDQTPLYTLMVNDLAAMFPNAQFLHVLRDGREVVHSMSNFLNVFAADRHDAVTPYLPEWTKDFTIACTTWSEWVETAMRFAQTAPQRCHTVRNADLRTAPEAAFRQILEFLQLPSDAGPATYVREHRVNSSFGSQQAARQAPWTQWTPQQRAVFRAEAGPTMLRYGMATAEELATEPQPASRP